MLNFYFLDWRPVASPSLAPIYEGAHSLDFNEKDLTTGIRRASSNRLKLGGVRYWYRSDGIFIFRVSLIWNNGQDTLPSSKNGDEVVPNLDNRNEFHQIIDIADLISYRIKEKMGHQHIYQDRNLSSVRRGTAFLSKTCIRIPNIEIEDSGKIFCSVINPPSEDGISKFISEKSEEKKLRMLLTDDRLLGALSVDRRRDEEDGRMPAILFLKRQFSSNFDRVFKLRNEIRSSHSSYTGAFFLCPILLFFFFGIIDAWSSRIASAVDSSVVTKSDIVDPIAGYFVFSFFSLVAAVVAVWNAIRLLNSFGICPPPLEGVRALIKWSAAITPSWFGAHSVFCVIFTLFLVILNFREFSLSYIVIGDVSNFHWIVKLLLLFGIEVSITESIAPITWEETKLLGKSEQAVVASWVFLGAVLGAAVWLHQERNIKRQIILGAYRRCRGVLGFAEIYSIVVARVIGSRFAIRYGRPERGFFVSASEIIDREIVVEEGKKREVVAYAAVGLALMYGILWAAYGNFDVLRPVRGLDIERVSLFENHYHKSSFLTFEYSRKNCDSIRSS